MNIIATHWFNEMGSAGSTIGIVVGEDEITGERKAYIGTGAGFSEDTDAKKITQGGGKFSLDMATKIVGELVKAE